jgi:hypothetical protein
LVETPKPVIDRRDEDGEIDVEIGPRGPNDRRATSIFSGGKPFPRPAQVLGHAEWIATDGVNIRRRELDQALVVVALDGIGRAHPGRLEELVRLEEVAPPVGGETGSECLEARAVR